MACSLNKRMTSNLDLIELASSNDQDVISADLVQVDLKSVVDAISAVNITACPPPTVSQPKCNGVSFKYITKIWKKEQIPTEKYSPVQSQELCYLQGHIQKMATRLLSITEMPEYKHLSFEELRAKHYEDVVIQENSISLPESQAQTLPIVEDDPNLTAEANILITKKGRSADFLGACSTIKNQQETSAKSESVMEVAQEPQKDGPDEAVFKFKTYPVAVRAKEPVICSLIGQASGVSLHKKIPKETEVITNRQESFNNPKMEFALELPKDCQNKAVFKFPTCAAVRAKETVSVASEGAIGGVSIGHMGQIETDFMKETTNTKVFPSFCLGKLGTVDLAKSTKNGKPWKKPKTTAKDESMSKPFIFSFTNIMDSMETKVMDPFCNPLSQKESKAQGNEVPEDNTAQSSSCEEFYDANSDSEETEQAKPSNSTGQSQQ